MASDALKFGDAMRGPSASVAEGGHWATIVRRVAVRNPRWAFPPRLPGGRTAGRRALFRDSNSLADSRRGYRSGAEEHEPDDPEDQNRKPGRDGQEDKRRRARFGLACFGRSFDDLALLSGCHGALDSLMSRTPGGATVESRRMIANDVSGFSRPGCQVAARRRTHCGGGPLATNRPHPG
jgi:hypothetical protein